MTHLLRRPADVPSLFARAEADLHAEAAGSCREGRVGRAALPLTILLAVLPVLKGASAILGVALAH